MMMGDFLTLTQLNLPVKIVIVNNSSLGFVAMEMKAGGYLDTGTDLKNPDFAAMARAAGVTAFQIKESATLADTLREAFAHPGPVLVDVITAKQELVMPPKIKLEQVKGFSLYMLKAIIIKAAAMRSANSHAPILDADKTLPMTPATHGNLACCIAFVLRCSSAATLPYLLAVAIGLPFPMWASMSSLIVSQANLQETKSALLWRLCGTMTGIALAMIVENLLPAFPQGNPVRIAAAVALCAALAHRWPGLRVAMWTVPVVYLSNTPHVALAETGLWRGAEVIFGGVIGALFHWLAEIAIGRLNRMRTGPGQRFDDAYEPLRASASFKRRTNK